jgi:hypothetical protein
MTEAEWLACSEPERMLEFLGSNASERKLRLYAVSCCLQMWHLMTDERSKDAVRLAERFADGIATRQERNSIHTTLDAETHHGIEQEVFGMAFTAATDSLLESAYEAAQSATGYTWFALTDDLVEPQVSITDKALRDAHASFLRCVFGPLPFRPINVNPTWRTLTVVALAEAVYDDRAFDRLPILADALEEAGCHDADILGHCRSEGEHVRGCWVVDLMLGKS